jgi:hypothetical protein
MRRCIVIRRGISEPTSFLPLVTSFLFPSVTKNAEEFTIIRRILLLDLTLSHIHPKLLVVPIKSEGHCFRFEFHKDITKYTGMLIIFVPAYFLAKNVWKTPNESEIE